MHIACMLGDLESRMPAVGPVDNPLLQNVPILPGSLERFKDQLRTAFARIHSLDVEAQDQL